MSLSIQVARKLRDVHRLENPSPFHGVRAHGPPNPWWGVPSLSVPRSEMEELSVDHRQSGLSFRALRPAPRSVVTQRGGNLAQLLNPPRPLPLLLARSHFAHCADVHAGGPAGRAYSRTPNTRHHRPFRSAHCLQKLQQAACSCPPRAPHISWNPAHSGHCFRSLTVADMLASSTGSGKQWATVKGRTERGST